MDNKRVAGYFRVSQARDDMKAPAIYSDEIERYCRYKRLELDKIYSDIDYSGYRGAPARPALEELIQNRRDYAAVIVPKLARFGRSVSNLVALFDLFDKDGIALIFLDLNMDTSTSQGRLLRHVMAAFAEYESDVKSDYSRANARRRALDGFPPTGNVPLGYVRKNKTFVIDKEGAEVVRGIYELYDGGQSMLAITASLNAQGIARPEGGLWRRCKVSRLLTNPAYVAMRRVDGKFVAGNWPPIITRALWERVQARVAEVAKRSRGNGVGHPTYLLVGLLKCGVCANNLTHWKSGAHMYACHRRPDGIHRCAGGRVRLQRAEDIVVSEFMARYPVAELRRADGSLEAQVSMRQAWAGATTAQRRDLLSLVIDKIVLVARPDPAPKKIVRTIEICWNAATLESDGIERLPAPIVPLAKLREKTCTKCARTKPLEGFHRERKAADGRGSVCAQCRNRDRLVSFHKTGAVSATEQAVLEPSPVGMTWAQWRRTHLL
jgi:DNA invertase Pin-like site-specific DNA recombinase